MPELPEVETIARDLHRVLVGQKISAIKSLDKKYSPVLSVLKKAALNQPIKRVYRRAKMLIIDCGKHFLVFHLKMTGQLIYRSKTKTIAGGHPIVSTGINVPNKFTRLVFSFKNSGILYFNDIRKFGWVKAVSVDEFDRLSALSGIEPLTEAFSFSVFQGILARRKKTSIKAALLDQKLVAGLGNIYVDEVLFKSGVRPSRRVNELTAAEQKKIWRSIPIILNKSIKERGTTFNSFLDPDGLRGNFVPHLKVYGRGGQTCKVCGQFIKKVRVAGRGTHYCAKCQK
jgi:formamidopyrimidine-DNA glycosylase